jgi:hypothetical protein
VTPVARDGVEWRRPPGDIFTASARTIEALSQSPQIAGTETPLAADPKQSETAGGAVSTVRDRPSEAEHGRQVRLSHWAIGLGEKDGQWRLFHWFGNQQRWCERGLAAIPKGRPTTLAEAFARNGGGITKPEAIALFKQGDRKSWPAKNLFESVCKPSRKKLADAIAKDIIRVTGQQKIGDPIPWNRQVRKWCCSVQIGYCCKDDGGNLRFRLAEQLKDGFTEEERSPG